MPSLTRGASGKAVELVQKTLSSLGFVCRADGVYGDETFSAVRRWQRTLGFPIVHSNEGKVSEGFMAVLLLAWLDHNGRL